MCSTVHSHTHEHQDVADYITYALGGGNNKIIFQSKVDHQRVCIQLRWYDLDLDLTTLTLGVSLDIMKI